jgi:superfamily I DNA/RNA helicase
MLPTIAIGSSFLGAFAKLPKPKQRKVTAFVNKFQSNPQSSGINYEKINDSRDPNFRSVRIDQECRGIVLKPDEGDVYILLWVDRHDDAYAWARRNRCQVNSTTGVLQLFETGPRVESTTSNAAYAEPRPCYEPNAEEQNLKPLFDLHDEILSLLGVPSDLFPLVQGLRSEDQLEKLEKQLPIEAFEALYLVAAGTPIDEVLEDYAAKPDRSAVVDDFETALKHPASQRLFYVLENERELTQMLHAPLEHWRIFLHPSQRQLVDRNWNGPTRVLGGAGTGKTVVAMHRARWLAANVLKADERILFTTFTKNLATDISNSLQRICSPEQFRRIEVTSLNEWVRRFLFSRGSELRMVFPGGDDGLYESCWQAAITRKPAVVDQSLSFFREEWERVVLPQRINSLSDYQYASRAGRGVALSRKQRIEIWPIFEDMRSELSKFGVITAEDATYEAIDLLAQHGSARPYRAVVVDEAQDFGSHAMRLIRHLTPENPNDLFLVGDGHQRIYQRRCSLSQCGISIVGRGRKLRINYRTTEQIRRFATALLEGIEIDDLDGGADRLTDYRSLVQGPRPEIYRATNSRDEEAWLAVRIRGLEKTGLELSDMCLVARTQYQIKAYQSALVGSGIPVCRLSREQADDLARAGVRLATMHRVKGLEFKAVLMAGVNQGVVPLTRAVDATSDSVERQLRDLNERALFHVAATRAVKYLLISCVLTPSEYLQNNDAVA